MISALLTVWFGINLLVLITIHASDGYHGYDAAEHGMTLPEYREWYWTRNPDYTWLANVLILITLFPSLLISLVLSGVKAIFSFLFIRKK